MYQLGHQLDVMLRIDTYNIGSWRIRRRIVNITAHGGLIASLG